MTRFVNGVGFQELAYDLQGFYEHMDEGEIDNEDLFLRQEIFDLCRSIIDCAEADGLEHKLWCPHCHELGDMTSIQDHGRCQSCHAAWQLGEKDMDEDEDTIPTGIGVWDDVDFDPEAGEYLVWYASPVDDDGEPCGPKEHTFKCDDLQAALNAAESLQKLPAYRNFQIERF